MNVLLRYYAKQGWHYWHNLSLRFKIELFIVGIIFVSFFSEKGAHLFFQLLNSRDITQIGLAVFTLHLILLFYAATVPFMYYILLPKQAGFHVLRVQPLAGSSMVMVLFLSSLKYQLIPLLLMVPLLIAFTLTTNVFAVAYFVTGILIYPLLFILTIHFLKIFTDSYYKSISLYFLFWSIYFLFFTGLYFYLDHYLLYQSVFLMLICGWFYYKRGILDNQQYWFNKVKKSVRAQSFTFIQYHDFPKIMRPLFARETLVSLRNIRYIRLKLISTMLYILLLLAGHEYFPDNYIHFVAAVTFLFIWLHYAYQFNEKYVQPEFPLFMRTMPVKFFTLVSARILSELIYILLLLVLQNVVLMLAGTAIATILYLSAGIIIFAGFILYIIAIVRIQFYHNPRLAGYAYHFLVIFSVMMIANFYLVGPLITGSLIIYLTLLARRQIAR